MLHIFAQNVATPIAALNFFHCQQQVISCWIAYQPPYEKISGNAAFLPNKKKQQSLHL